MKKKQKAPKLPTASIRTPSSKASTSLTVNPWKSIRIDRPFPLPPYVKEALQKIYDAGHFAYIVGGSVRDFLLGRESKDHDIATSADPNELCKLFPNAIIVGKAFGVIKVPTGTHPPLLEIATFRKDMNYEDSRHPGKVVFGDPLEDALRRDFTINALFYDPKTLKIMDAVQGFEDLKKGVLRAIGDPRERFREDALRLLRAVRFQTRLGFQLEEATAKAIQDRARLISRVSAERIRDELTLIWTGPRPGEGLRMLSDLGLLVNILPEIEALRDNDALWIHLLRMLEYLAKKNLSRTETLSWAAVLHEVGRKNLTTPEAEGGRLVRTIAQRLKMSRNDMDRIANLVADYPKFKDVFQMRESTLQRFIRLEYFEELLAFHEAEAVTSDGNLAFFEFCSSLLAGAKSEEGMGYVKLIDGTDLIQLGFRPGPEFSEILNVVDDLTLEKKLITKEEALEFVVKTFVK